MSHVRNTAECNSIEANLKKGRTRVKNTGVGFNARSAQGRRLKELIIDFGLRTPLDATDVAVAARIRSLAIITMQFERLSVEIANGDAIDPASLAALNTAQAKLMFQLHITNR